MKKPSCIALLLVSALAVPLFGQESNTSTAFRNYYYDYKLSNPAFAGTLARNVITTTFSNSSSEVKTIYGSYERKIHDIKSGVGGYALYDRVGPVKQYFLGGFFSKTIEFTEETGFRFGTQVFYRRLSLENGYYLPLNPDDLTVVGFNKESGLNADIGSVFYSKIVTLGASVKNLVERRTEHRRMNFIAMRDFKIADLFKATPSVLVQTNFEESAVSVNNIFTIKKWILLGAGYTMYEGSEDSFDFNIGVNFNDWVQVVAHAYSSDRVQMDEGNEGRRMELFVRLMIPDARDMVSK